MLDVLYYPVSAVMWLWHKIFASVLGPSSGLAWALSVVFLVLTLRALMIKPFLLQMRSARAMRALSPQLAELRKRHGDDRKRLAEETQKLQRAHGVNPLGALIPALIQVPVFLALLHVLRYFNRPGLTFEQNAAIPNYVFGPASAPRRCARSWRPGCSARRCRPGSECRRSCSTPSAGTSTGSTSWPSRCR